jgi:type I restriction enzyme S subunit
MVREGYKETAVGIIPEDWKVMKIDDLGEVVRGGSPRPAGDPRYFNGSYIPWLTVASLTNIPTHQMEVTQTVGGLTEEGSKRSRKLSSGTVIIANSGATLGIAKILGITCCANDGIAAIINQTKADKIYFCQFFNTLTVKLREVIATGNGQPNLNTALIRDISIPFPPQEEQQAIAKALSDVDGLINGLEKLIAKKQDIKIATMQQLLTGKTRLPGFSEGKGYKQTELGEIPEDWDVLPFGSIAEKIVGGGTPSRSNPLYWGGRIPWATVKDFSTFDSKRTQESITVQGLKNSSSNLITKGTVITSTRMAVGKAVVYDVDIAINQDLKAIFPKYNLDTNFLYCWFQKNGASLEDLGSGSTVMGLSLSDLRGVAFLLPTSKDEQQEIAQIFSDMDKEIESLQSRIDKTKSIKQGMMQELLTGKTRLI